LFEVDRIFCDRPDKPSPVPRPVKYLSRIQRFIEVKMGSRHRVKTEHVRTLYRMTPRRKGVQRSAFSRRRVG
jgi:hypothetical protein